MPYRPLPSQRGDCPGAARPVPRAPRPVLGRGVGSAAGVAGRRSAASRARGAGTGSVSGVGDGSVWSVPVPSRRRSVIVRSSRRPAVLLHRPGPARRRAPRRAHRAREAVNFPGRADRARAGCRKACPVCPYRRLRHPRLSPRRARTGLVRRIQYLRVGVFAGQTIECGIWEGESRVRGRCRTPRQPCDRGHTRW